MSLKDHFPSTAAAYPALLNWYAPFDWTAEAAATALQTLYERLIEQQFNGRDEFLRLASAIRNDLTLETARAAGGPEAPNVDGARFVLAVPAAHVTLQHGLHGDSFGWLHWAISRTHDFDARINHAEYSLPPFDGATDRMNVLVANFTVDWVRTAYFVARKFGGMDELATRFLGYSVRTALAAIRRGDVESGIGALAAIINWVSDNGHSAEEALTRLALDLFSTDGLPPREKVVLGMVFVTRAARWTGRSSQEWAAQLLADMREHLVEHETLQLMSVAISYRERWIEMRAALLVEIRRLAEFYRALAPSLADATAALESRVSILHPLIFGLTEFGTTDDLMDVLWAWYGTSDERRGDSNILFISSAHGRGVTYVWPTGRWTTERAIDETLQTMLDAISAALTDYFRGPAGDRLNLFDERLAGVPAFPEADRLRAAVDAHYSLDHLSEHLPPDIRPRSIVILPAHRDPFQALFLERLGWLSPMEASLADARPMRQFRTVSIWPGSTQLTEAEVESIREIGTAAGWRIKVPPGDLDEAAFRTFYQDAEADILWCIGHGEQSPYRLRESGLILANDVLLPIEDIASLDVPHGDRRLVMFNICSSGATQNRGGLARLGLGHYLASPRQAVIGHLWPIDQYAALAFGCSFALSACGANLNEAFGDALRLMRDQPALLKRLADVNPRLESIERLRADRLEDHLRNLLNWGCPVLLT